MTAINPAVLKWFASRAIGMETVFRMGIYSGKRETVTDGEGRPVVDDHGEEQHHVVPDAKGNVICFPFIEGDMIVAEKYRTADKRMWQRKAPKKTFYNGDILDDPLLHTGEQALVIVEGEMDACAAIEAGHSWTVSVPDGAPPARDKDGRLIEVPEGSDDIDPENDGKFSFIVNNWDRLAPIKRIIIAVDDDEPGRRLAAELVRRLGRERCWFVTFPTDQVVPVDKKRPDGLKRACKDANEVLVHLGATPLLSMLDSAKEYPFSGVYRLSDFPQTVAVQYYHPGLYRLWPHLRPFHPALMVITGLAGSGKSTFATQLLGQMALKHDWRIAIASPEMILRPYITGPLTTVKTGKPLRECSAEEIVLAERWIDQQFVFIDPDPIESETHDLDWFLSRLSVAVKRYGIRAYLLDPWNEIEHSRRRDENTDEYTSRAIRQLKAFNRKHDIMGVIAAHPTKEGASKTPDKISLYDISGSAHFANKADIGVVVANMASNPDGNGFTSIIVKKVKYHGDDAGGHPGTAELQFDSRLRLFVD